MASLKKFTELSTRNLLRHNERTLSNPSNKDIDPSRFLENYSLSPIRPISSWDYFKNRKQQLYCFNRSDVKVTASWVVTLPIDCPSEQEQDFFQTTYDFLCQRYGEENCIQAIVHKDESGNPHLHFVFIPVADDPKHGGEKICANDVLNPKELRCFHTDLQRYLTLNNINANVINGITKAQGGSRSVRELKKERERTYQQQYSLERSRW